MTENQILALVRLGTTASPFSSSGYTLLGSSDKRKFGACTTERFQLAPETADTLVPDGLLVQMFSAYNGEPDVFYMSGDGDLLWLSVRMLSSPSRILTYIDRSILWKHPTLLPVLTTLAAVIPVLVSCTDLTGVVQVPAHAFAGALVGVAQFGKAVVESSWKDHLWALGSKCGPPDALPMVVAAAGGADTPRPGADQEPAGNAPAMTQDGAAGVEEIEKLTPEDVSTRLRAALLQALRTSLVALPNSAFPMPMTTLYTAHILPARPFSRTATTPVDIKHSTFKSLPAFLRASDEGGLPKLMDARPDVQVSTVFPTHAAVIAYEPHCTVGEEDEQRRRAEGRETQQAANAEKTTTVTELTTLPLLEDFRLKSALFTYVEKHDLVNCLEKQFINISSDTIRVFSAALYCSLNAKGTTCTHITGFEPFNIFGGCSG
ncbi:hypothetical protein EDB85DRAFT_2222145 [Lactarius pseudohatsudake]|nr:hypothetical protein EDB85DRAFT_2222145 [Lactarius pseudohatsudake]